MRRPGGRWSRRRCEWGLWQRGREGRPTQPDQLIPLLRRERPIHVLIRFHRASGPGTHPAHRRRVGPAFADTDRRTGHRPNGLPDPETSGGCYFDAVTPPWDQMPPPKADWLSPFDHVTSCATLGDGVVNPIACRNPERECPWLASRGVDRQSSSPDAVRPGCVRR